MTTTADLKSWVESHFDVTRWRGDEADIRCVFHDDTTASAGINLTKRVWNCRRCDKGGTLSALAEQLHLTDLPPYSGNGKGRFEKGILGPEVCRYDYHDKSGRLSYQVIRFRDPKEFRPFNPETKQRSMRGLEHIPYHLPQLLKTIGEKEIVWIGEGERDCDRLASYGVTATTNQMGVGSAKLWDQFASKYFPVGTKCILIPDADAPGHRLMEHAARCLLRRGCLVKMLSLGYEVTEDHGKDVSDWFDAGHTFEELKALAASTQNLKPESLPAVTEDRPAEIEELTDPEALVRDYGHAFVLAPFFLDRYRWAVHRKAWMGYDGKVWVTVSDELVSKIAADILRRDYTRQMNATKDKGEVNRLTGLLREICTYVRLQGALSFLKGWPGIHTNAEEWDTDLWALNLNNGVVDLHTGELRPHSAEDLMTKIAPIDFDPEASGKQWDAHLDIFLPDGEIRRQVQRGLGVSLVGVTLEEALDLWHGTGGNGKTTTARVLMTLLGDYAKRAAPNLLVQTKYDRHSTELADLASIRLVFSIEIDQAKHLAEALVKELTGGDVKKARYMRCDFFEFAQTFSIILLVNHRPKITGTDEGIWRRIRLIPWTGTVPEELKRPQEEVVSALTQEGSAILNWLLAGLRDWQADRRWTAPAVKAATQKYREAEDMLGPFLADTCEIEPRYRVSVPDLFGAYQTWCVGEGEVPLGKKEFAEKLRDHGYETKRIGHENVHCWEGLRLHATRVSVSSLRESNVAGYTESEVARSRKTEEADSNSIPELDLQEKHVLAATARNGLSEYWNSHDSEGGNGHPLV